MGGLIDRSETIKSLVNIETYTDKTGKRYKKLNDVIDVLCHMPGAQLTIKRCKDCDKYKKDEKTGLKKCTLLNFFPTEEWYCKGADL